MKKAQSLLEIALLMGLVVVATIAIFAIYNNTKTKLVDMSNVKVETAGLCQSTGHGDICVNPTNPTNPGNPNNGGVSGGNQGAIVPGQNSGDPLITNSFPGGVSGGDQGTVATSHNEAETGGTIGAPQPGNNNTGNPGSNVNTGNTNGTGP